MEKLPKAWREEGSLYNPINCYIQDEQRLYDKDLKDKNKRKRYELRYDLERQIHKEGLSEEERSKQIGLNKIHHGRFTEGLNRGFDILTNSKFNDKTDVGSKTVYEPHCKKPEKLWTKIQANTNGFQEMKTINELRAEDEENEVAVEDQVMWKT